MTQNLQTHPAETPQVQTALAERQAGMAHLRRDALHGALNGDALDENVLETLCDWLSGRLP